MSCNFYYRSTFIRLQGISSPEQFEQLLRRFASGLRQDLLASNHDHDLWSMYDCIDDIIEQKEEAEAINAMLEEMENYFIEQEFDDNGMTMTLESNNDDTNHCDDFVDALAVFLMPYYPNPYLTLHTTYHDGCSASCHQDILFRSGDQTFKASADEVIERLLSNPAAVLKALGAQPGVGQPVKQVSDPYSEIDQRCAAA